MPSRNFPIRPSTDHSVHVAPQGAPVAKAPAPKPGRVALPPQSGLSDEGEIGRGGFGSVHKARDARLLRQVALKVYEPKQTRNSDAALRFVEEAQITAQLDHPNIAPVYTMGSSEDGRLYFSMKLLEGQTLTQLLRGAQPQGLFRLLQIFLKVCDAVTFAHARGVVHRDLKPDNVMVGEHGEVYLLDWGLARLLEAERPSQQVKVTGGRGRGPDISGTAAYMAPEQALGLRAPADVRTDVFGLGGILYEVLTGKPPYTGKSVTEKLERARRCDVTPPHEAAPGRALPPALCRIAMRAMAPKPADRHESAEAVRDEVALFLQGGGWFTTRTFAAGELIVSERAPADAAYLITRGVARAFHQEGQREQVLREMGPGEVFGEAAIFAAEVRTASVRALTEVEAVQVTRESLEEAAGLGTWVGNFVRALAVRFRALDLEAAGLRRDRDGARLAQRVLEHLARRGVEAPGGQREAPWPALAAALVEQFGLGGEELLARVREEGLGVDLARGVVFLER